MRKLSFCFDLALLMTLTTLSLTAQSNSDGWKRYENKLGKFAVMLPGDPQDSVNPSREGTESHSLMVKDKGTAYLLIFTLETQEQSVDEGTYGEFKRGVFEKLPMCSVESEGSAEPALSGYIGRSYKMSCDVKGTKLKIEGNLYWGKHYSYAVMALTPQNAQSPADPRFLGSFSLLGQ